MYIAIYINVVFKMNSISMSEQPLMAKRFFFKDDSIIISTIVCTECIWTTAYMIIFLYFMYVNFDFRYYFKY